MIIKCLTSKTPRYFQILEYLNNEAKIYNQNHETFIHKQHLYGLNNKQIAREFMKNEENRIVRKSNNIKFYHEILAFSDLDHSKLSISIIKNLTQEYLKQRSPYIQAYAIGHFNNNSYHTHIISSPLEIYTGINLRMSKERFAELKIYMQNYQLEHYPELSNSIVKHGAKKEISNELKLNTMKDKKQPTLDYLREKINFYYISSNGNQHFLELLKQNNFKTYTRDGYIVGIIHNLRKYRFTKLMPGSYLKIDTRQEYIEKNKEDKSNELEHLEKEKYEKELHLLELEEIRKQRENRIEKEIGDIRTQFDDLDDIER